jgi:hypothetical protein
VKVLDKDAETQLAFLLEEYKLLYASISEFQNRYTRLETLTFSALILIYGYLIGSKVDFADIVWWGIPVLLTISAGRCLAYYLIITFRLSPYIMTIENEVFDGRRFGFQKYITKDGSPVLNIAANLFVWFAMILISLALALWHQQLVGK